MYFLKMSKSSVSCFGKLFLLLRSDLKVSWLHQIYSSLHRSEFPQMFVGKKTNKQTSSGFFPPCCRQTWLEVISFSFVSLTAKSNYFSDQWSQPPWLRQHNCKTFFLPKLPFSTCSWCFSSQLGFFTFLWWSPSLTIHSLHFAVATIALLCFVVAVVVVAVVRWTVL